MGTRGGSGFDPGGGLTPAMRWTIVVVGAVAAIGLIVSAWLLWSPGAVSPTSPPDGAASLRDGTGDDTTAGASTSGPVAGATPVPGSEVPDPEETAQPRTGVPPLPAKTPLVAAPLPAEDAARGALVEGFPTHVVDVMGGADVIDSAISVEGETMQVSLTVRTDASADEVRAHYGQQWAQLGLAPAVTDADAAYHDEFSSLTLAIQQASGTGTVYAVYGTLRTE